MSKLKTITFTYLISCVLGSTPFHSLPDVPDEFRAEATKTGSQIDSFLGIWDKALDFDGKGDGARLNNDPALYIIPTNIGVINLAPQDVPNPFYLRGAENGELRKKFLLEHMSLDFIEPDLPELSNSNGIDVEMMNGKNVTVKKTEKGQFTFNTIDGTTELIDTIQLPSGIYIFVINRPLFDNQEATIRLINPRIADQLQGPTGAPLDLGPPLILDPIGPPSFNFRGEPEPIELEDGSVVFPPAPPTEEEIRRFNLEPPSGPPAAPPAVPPAAPPAGLVRNVEAPVAPPAGPPAAPAAPPAEPPLLRDSTSRLAQLRQEQRSGKRA